MVMKVINTKADFKFSGTYRQGEVDTTLAALTAAFGPPAEGPDAHLDKCSCEFFLEFEDGTLACIYQSDREGTGKTERGRTEWRIGGRSQAAVAAVKEALAAVGAPA